MSEPTIDALIAAAVAGDGVAAAAMLQAAPGLAREANMFGVRAIHAAHYAEQDLIVEMLWRAGVEGDGFLAAELDDAAFVKLEIAADPGFVRAFNAGGATALHGAAYWGALETARVLIAAGADVRAQSRDGFLDIHPLGSAVATPNGDPKTVNVPNPSDDEDNVLELVDLLLDAGADVNAQRKDGGTALHTAAYRGHLRVIKRLIARGADLTILARWGEHNDETPADTARAQHQSAAAELLESHAR